MEYVNLGQSGLKVSRICLGMMSYGSSDWQPWVLEGAAAEPFVRRALELGINFFDTADVYSSGVSEEVTGRLLGEHVDRDEVVIATKAFFPMREGDPNARGLSRKHILESIDRSLRRLQTDYVDLYQIHRWDPTTPIEETMEALHDVVRSGKARYIGASSMHAWQFAKAQHVADLNSWTRFVSMQPHYNLVYREEEREMLPQCADMGVGVIPWSPLAKGVLAGTRTRDGEQRTTRAGTDELIGRRYVTDVSFDIADRVAEVAAQHGTSPAQVALAWVLHQPVVTAPIVGATKLEHLEEAVAAVDIELTEDERIYLEAPYLPREILGHS